MSRFIALARFTAIRFSWLILALSAFPIATIAQTPQTPVSATVVDPFGIPYNFSSGYASIACPGNQQPTFNGSPLTRTITITGFDGFGHFSMVLWDVGTIQPVGCGWQFMITWKDNLTSFTTGIIGKIGQTPAITGQANVDLSAAISAFAVPLPSAGGAGATPPGGQPFQMQINKGGTPAQFGGTNCVNLDVFPNPTQVRVDCDTHSKGPNPNIDITRFGARALVGIPQQTTASCNGTTAITLTSAIDFINGDGFVAQKCGPATTLPTPGTPTAAIPKGILNGITTRSYKVIAEDYGNGLTAASAAITITNAAATFGTNLINISSTSTASGVTTVTTSAAHNIELGAFVSILGTGNLVGAAPTINQLWYVQTTPTGTTFTVGLPAANGSSAWVGYNGSSTGGTVSVPAHIWLRWPAQVNVLRYWIYRQDGGAGAYNLVGVAQGIDPFFDDYNFGLGGQQPAYVPTTAPAAAQNQSLDTTIVSGAGTVNIVVANSATATASGVVVQHDNVKAFQAAYAAALAVQGANILIPLPTATNSFFSFSYPLSIGSQSPAMLVVQQMGAMLMFQPLIPWNQAEWIGISANNGGSPSFNQNSYASIQGFSYPNMLANGVSGVKFDRVSFSSNQPQQISALVDGTPAQLPAGGTVTIIFDHCYFSSGGAGSVPLFLRGGGFFDYVLNSTATSGGGSADFFDRPSISVQTNGAIVNSQSPGISYFNNLTLIGGGILFSSDDIYPASGTLGGTVKISNILHESTTQPTLNFRNINSNSGGYYIDNIAPADSTDNAWIIDMSAPTLSTNLLSGVFVDHVSSASGELVIATGQGVNQLRLAGNNANDLNNAQAISGGLTAANFDNGNGQSVIGNLMFETGGGYKAVNNSPFFVQGANPIPGTVTVAAGGSVPVGSFDYFIAPVDWNNGIGTVIGFSQSAVTTPGNQTVNLTWTAPTQAPQGYHVYRCTPSIGVTSICGSGGRVNGALVTGTTFSDTSASVGATVVNAAAGGPTGMSFNTGVWSPTHVVTNGAGKTTITSAATVPRAVSYPDAAGTIALTIASGTATMTTASIAGGACGTTVTVPATNVATTDAITWSFNAAVGINPGELSVTQWPTANNVNFQYCNETGAPVTPTAATLNWRVTR
jgi:hypothetical protein